MIDKIETTLTIRDKQYQVNWNLKQVNVLVGDNGSGKSKLLKKIESNYPCCYINTEILHVLLATSSIIIEITNWFKEFTDKQLYIILNSHEYYCLSKGEKYLLDLFASIYIRPRNSTVLIDYIYIEQNLDTKTQRKLLPFLIEQRPDLQFIVTTHSPSIVNRHYEWQTVIEDILTEIN